MNGSLARAGLLALCVAAAGAPGQPAPSPLADGDAHWDRRAEGAVGDSCAPAEVDAAIASYRRALSTAPESLALRARLMRALQYRGAFCAGPLDESRRALDEGKDVAEETVARVERLVGGAKGEARLAALRRTPEAAAVYFWAAACWGQWAVLHGNFAAAREGVAGKVRELARTVVDLDERYEEAGGHRVLGRLHDKTPSIPFITGWASTKKALAHLRTAIALAPDDRAAQLFLGEALLAHVPGERAEALRLLTACATAPPRPEYLVEDRRQAKQARALLDADGAHRR